MEKYEKLEKVGEGAHGVVYKAKVLTPISDYWSLSGKHGIGRKRKKSIAEEKEEEEDSKVEFVAIKKIRVKDSAFGLSMDAIREIKLLQELKHRNIMKMIEVFNHNQNINLVMEYMDYDLEDVIKAVKEFPLSPADIKSYMKMILSAVDHCHKNWVLHRDLKPSNFLVGQDGHIRLADFGLGKIYGSPKRNLSPQACTLWYRAPELLFGARSYGAGADMWSVGCIFAELMLRRPLFPGTSDIGQLSTIFACLGTPNSTNWPDVDLLPNYIPFEEIEPTDFKALFPAASNEARDLCQKLLLFDPSQRITASKALEHPYFSTYPEATSPEKLPKVKLLKKKHSIATNPHYHN